MAEVEDALNCIKSFCDDVDHANEVCAKALPLFSFLLKNTTTSPDVTSLTVHVLCALAQHESLNTYLTSHRDLVHLLCVSIMSHLNGGNVVNVNFLNACVLCVSRLVRYASSTGIITLLKAGAIEVLLCACQVKENYSQVDALQGLAVLLSQEIRHDSNGGCNGGDWLKNEKKITEASSTEGIKRLHSAGGVELLLELCVGNSNSSVIEDYEVRVVAADILAIAICGGQMFKDTSGAIRAFASSIVKNKDASYTASLINCIDCILKSEKVGQGVVHLLAQDPQFITHIVDALNTVFVMTRITDSSNNNVGDPAKMSDLAMSCCYVLSRVVASEEGGSAFLKAKGLTVLNSVLTVSKRFDVHRLALMLVNNLATNEETAVSLAHSVLLNTILRFSRSPDPKTLRILACVVHNLTKTGINKIILSQKDVLPHLLRMVKCDDPDTRTSALGALAGVTENTHVTSVDNSAEQMITSGDLSYLISLLRKEKKNLMQRRYLTRILAAVATESKSHAVFAAAQVQKMVLNLLQSRDGETQFYGLLLICNLSATAPGRDALNKVRASSAINMFAKVSDPGMAQVAQSCLYNLLKQGSIVHPPPPGTP